MASTEVFLVWSSAALPDSLAGPWSQYRVVSEQLALVESTETLSRVYHEVKWSLPGDAALLVVPLHERPKLKGLAAGTTTWLRDRLPGPDTRA